MMQEHEYSIVLDNKVMRFEVFISYNLESTFSPDYILYKKEREWSITLFKYTFKKIMEKIPTQIYKK